MAASVIQKRVSLAEFLAWEEAQPERHERIGGVTHAMVGGTLRHNRITRNVVMSLSAALPTRFEMFFGEVKIVTPAEDVIYPDALVACGELDDTQTLLETAVVGGRGLSPSAARQDERRKRWAYATLRSLRHYLLIGQNEAVAEVASWQEDGGWRSVIHRDVEAAAALPALGVELPCREIFAGSTPQASPDDAPTTSGRRAASRVCC